jgi:hypothetical protein
VRGSIYPSLVRHVEGLFIDNAFIVLETWKDKNILNIQTLFADTSFSQHKCMKIGDKGAFLEGEKKS